MRAQQKEGNQFLVLQGPPAIRNGKGNVKENDREIDNRSTYRKWKERPPATVSKHVKTGRTARTERKSNARAREARGQILWVRTVIKTKWTEHGNLREMCKSRGEGQNHASSFTVEAGSGNGKRYLRGGKTGRKQRQREGRRGGCWCGPAKGKRGENVYRSQPPA